MGARPRRDAVPRGAPRPGHSHAREPAGGRRGDRPGAGDARRRDRRVGGDPGLGGRADSAAEQRLFPRGGRGAARGPGGVPPLRRASSGPSGTPADVRPHARAARVRAPVQQRRACPAGRIARSAGAFRCSAGSSTASWTSALASSVEDEAAVWREFDFVADLLSDGRPHLCGERFGAADLTFAAHVGACDRPARLRRSTSPAGHPAPGHRGSRRAGARAPGWAVRPPPVRRLPADARRLTYLASRQSPDA